MTKQVLLVISMTLTTESIFAFNGHVATEGPVRIEIGSMAAVTDYGKPCNVTVTVSNSGQDPLTVQLRLGYLADAWRPVGKRHMTVTVPAGGTQVVAFQIATGPVPFDALYPVHVHALFSIDGTPRTAHAVQVFETRFTRPGPPVETSATLPVTRVPVRGGVLLTAIKSYRVGWAYFDKPAVTMPVGWQGSAQPSRANFVIRSITRGATRAALNMHPAWWQGHGTVFVDYRLKLPPVQPITFSFGNAIRDVVPPEPPSDGVTFRVFVNGKNRFERHTASRTWVDGRVDLSSYSGTEILLRLECHPGPQKDTTCDSAFWGDPIITSGERPKPFGELDRTQLRDRARRIIATGRTEGPSEFIFTLTDGMRASVVLSPWGLPDGAIGLGNAHRCTIFDGLDVSIMKCRLGAPSLLVPVTAVRADRIAPGHVRILHELAGGKKTSTLTAEVLAEAAGLRLRVACPERITDLAAGRFDQTARRVYYGHGYCIVEPGAFRASYGGHNLSTSHVGCDFTNGLSLVMACDNPPDYFEVNPDDRRYALHTHMDGTLTFVPSLRGVIDCAKKYRTIYDRKPSPGFARKAGRFVFDVWGGRYADNARLMQRMVDYGLTDSMLTLHVWQRWGYDYRLPDIYPPNPQLGTIDDMRAIGTVCDAAGIPWGLHDNYIDFYPDAEDYSYDHICFTEAGTPIKAWINTGRDAQSYRFRPDHIMPFIQRNVKRIGPSLKPNHYFIDVFTSINMFDFYDRHGTFHASLETRKHWGEAFRWIQEYLGPGTITTSEAGDDQLVGFLDGADCQHMNLSPTGGYFQHRVPCTDWERFPWFDAVLHDRFSLHGVGYPGRYEGGRSRRFHGIESDDYISDEMLLGHALMIDRSSMRRGAVRTYWLGQDFIRSIATDTIADVQFAGDDIHRITVTWTSGARVHVNRGRTDWPVANKIVPPYGYYATHGSIESSIERVDGVIVEQSRSPGRIYVNGRGFNPDASLAITPQVKAATHRNGRRFTMPIVWRARQPAPKDLVVFLHFKSPRSRRYDKIAFQGDYHPSPGTSTWRGDVRTGSKQVIEIPEEFGAGRYDIVVGLYDPATGARSALDADETGHHNYVLGELIADGSGKNVTGIRVVPHEAPARPEPRWNHAGTAITFGPIVTTGAFRCAWQPESIVLTPLPGLPACAVELDAAALTGSKNVTVSAVRAVDRQGTALRKVRVKGSGSRIKFTTTAGVFAYHVELTR